MSKEREALEQPALETKNKAYINFGQHPFSYEPPAGYKAMKSKGRFKHELKVWVMIGLAFCAGILFSLIVGVI